MSANQTVVSPASTESETISRLLRQYGHGAIQFSGADNALYERHLVFDNIVDPEAAGPRERFEAIARSVRDVLSQRWVRTEQTYERENPKRVYYLSMEFLIGCFLDSMATMQLPAMGYGLRYEYGMFKQAIRDGWQQEQPDNWLRRQDPWEVARPHERVEVKLNCSFEVRGGSLRAIVGKTSTLIGIPFDRPI